MSTLLALVVGLGLITLLLVIYDYMHLRKVTRVHEAAIIKGSQVGVIPEGFEYADEMTDFCYQAALSGWQPNNCNEMFQFAQVNYPQFADQLTTFWPWYYQNTFWPTFGGSSGWWAPNHRHWGRNFHGRNRRHVHGGRRRSGNNRRSRSRSSWDSSRNSRASSSRRSVSRGGVSRGGSRGGARGGARGGSRGVSRGGGSGSRGGGGGRRR